MKTIVYAIEYFPNPNVCEVHLTQRVTRYSRYGTNLPPKLLELQNLDGIDEVSTGVCGSQHNIHITKATLYKWDELLERALPKIAEFLGSEINEEITLELSPNSPIMPKMENYRTSGNTFLFIPETTRSFEPKMPKEENAVIEKDAVGSEN